LVGVGPFCHSPCPRISFYHWDDVPVDVLSVVSAVGCYLYCLYFVFTKPKCAEVFTHSFYYYGFISHYCSFDNSLLLMIAASSMTPTDSFHLFWFRYKIKRRREREREREYFFSNIGGRETSIGDDNFGMSYHEDSSASGQEEPWVNWFCSLKGHEMFCRVERSYIEDGFNLYGLRGIVPNFTDCLDLILDRIAPDESDDSHLTQSAFTLYGLIHARYIITAHGLDTMYNKVRDAKGFPLYSLGYFLCAC
jgi:Casein kinase II, beta subunit